jgi:Flp pilus assembly protein TadD
MLSRTFAAAVLAASFLPAVQAADTPDVQETRPSTVDRMATARRHLDAKDFSRAIAELQLVVREQPNHADAHNLLGYSWRKQAKPDLTKAYQHYYTALRIDPRHKGAHEYIGQAYVMEKRLPQAQQHLAELQKICGGTACPEYQELAKAIADSQAAK